MRDGRTRDRLPGEEPRCTFERTLEGEYCEEKAEVDLDGSGLCKRHADRLRLQERVAYWRAIMAHADLWSGEARRRGRWDAVGPLDLERARAAGALKRASAALQTNKEGGSRDGPEGERVDGEGEDGYVGVRFPLPWWSLLLLSSTVTG